MFSELEEAKMKGKDQSFTWSEGGGWKVIKHGSLMGCAIYFLA